MCTGTQNRNLPKASLDNIFAPKGENAERFFPGLVALARAKHPIPSRTRPLSAAAPMVLRLKTWESRSPPDLERNENPSETIKTPITDNPVAG